MATLTPSDPTIRAVVATLVALVGLGLAMIVHEDPRHLEERRLAGTPGDEPLSGGQRMSIDEATGVLPFDLFLPQTSADNDRSLRELWVDADTVGEAYAIYESGVIVIVDPRTAFPLSLEEWYARQVEDGVPSHLDRIRGIDAYIVEPENGETGSIKLFLGDAVVTVIGNGTYDGTQLRATAASLTTERTSERLAA